MNGGGAARKLDVVIPSFNRPARLFRLLQSGLDLGIPEISFVVIDDGSSSAELIANVGHLNTQQVCAYFQTSQIVYVRNNENIGVAGAWCRYYRDYAVAPYTMWITDKDEFIAPAPILSALAKLDDDSRISMVVISMRQRDRVYHDSLFSVRHYTRLSGREFIARYVEDLVLQHCSVCAIMRLGAARSAGLPRDMNLRRFGLDDAFGIDLDFVLLVGANGDVEFEHEPHVRRTTHEGGTEKYPLTFAYTYYQYARRALRELRSRKLISRKTEREFVAQWLLLMCRGLLVSYRPVHGTELERGASRIGKHLRLPIFLYLPLQAFRYRIVPIAETKQLYCDAIEIAVRDVLQTGRKRISSIKRAFSARKIRQLAGRFAASRVAVPGAGLNHQVALAFQAGCSAESIIGTATNLQHLDRSLSAAERDLCRVTEAVPLWAEAHRALGRNLWFQGRFQEALSSFREGELCLAKVARLAGCDSNAVVILPGNCNTVIGLMGHLDAFVKNKILSDDARPYYLFSRANEVANPIFLDYWADYITIVRDPQEIERLSSLEPAYGVNWNWVLPDQSGNVAHVHAGIAKIQRQWTRQSRGPLLRLKAHHVALKARKLGLWGFAPDDWFVCLHVRSSGFYEESRSTAQHFRNTPIEDYYPLIRFILAQGGRVIRMGDATMPPLDLAAIGSQGDRVIDYALSPERSPELDVALCASCRLFVTSPSGLHTVAHAFGRPVCGINLPVYAGFPWHLDEVFIPQRYFSRALGRVLTLEEILSSDVPHMDHHFLFERAGIELIPARPEDIVEAVREALDPAGYSIADRDVGRRVIELFERFNALYDTNISGRLGLHFAAAYAADLCPQPSPDCSR